MKHKAMRLTFVSMLILIFALALVSAGGPYPGTGAYVNSIWQDIILSPDEYTIALLTHEIDVGTVPRPIDLPLLIHAGFTIVSSKRIGQSFLMENNRVWPTGIPYIYIEACNILSGYPDPAFVPHEWRAEYFRKSLHRLIDKDLIIGELYAPLKQKAEYWLPPGQAMWIKPGLSLPTYDPMSAVALLNAAGFVQGNRPNPDYDPSLPWSAEFIRIDPISGLDLDMMTYTYFPACAPPTTITGITYYAPNPVEAPLGYEMALMITNWWRQAGVPVQLVPTTWGSMVMRLVNNVLEDYQMMTGVEMIWGSTSPEILKDLTYSENLPLWNFAYMNYSRPYDGISCIPPPVNPYVFVINRDADYWGEQMFRSLDVTQVQQAAHEIQEVLATHEPYLPLLESHTFYAFPGPSSTSQGYLGIVNMPGFGPMSNYDEFWMLLGRADRQNDELMIFGLTQHLDSLNPLIADTSADWSVLHGIVDTLLERNPYNHKYMAWAAEPGAFVAVDPTNPQIIYHQYMKFDPDVGYTPLMEPWIGPGRQQMGGNGVYDAPVTYDPETGELATYNGIPVADVTEGDLVNDDQLGMRTQWRLRENLYWHDSDPGPDGKPGTVDDGTVHPVTTADVEFIYDLLIKQENERYFSNWWYVYDATTIWDAPPLVGTVPPTDNYAFEIYEERRWVFAFEDHSEVSVLVPEHIWAPDLAGPDGIFCTGDDTHHQFWTGWQVPYIEDPIHPGYTLSRLIGFGPFMYHIAGPGGPGWQPGVCTHLEDNDIYFGTFQPFHYLPPQYCIGEPSRILRGDVDLNQLVELPDLAVIIDAFGSHPGDPHWDPKADIAHPAQFVQLDDVNLVIDEFGQTWGPYRPYTIPPDP